MSSATMTSSVWKPVFFIALTLISAWLAAAERAPATVHRRGGLDPVENVFIDAHTIAVVIYGIDETGQTANLKSEDVARIQYAQSQDPQVLRTVGMMNSRKYAEVLPFYDRIIKRGNASQHDIIQAHLNRALALQRLGRIDEAEQGLKAFIEEFSIAYAVLDAYQQLFNVLLAGDKVDEAKALLDTIDKKATKEWFKINKTYHTEAGIVVAYGRAKILAKTGAHGQAATALDSAMANINPQDRPQLWREAALLRANSFQKAGDGPNAIRSWQALVYQPIGGQRQAEALLALSTLQEEAGQTMAAYDLACRAAVRAGVSEATKRSAVQQAQKMAKALEADDSLTVEQRKVYSRYARSL